MLDHQEKTTPAWATPRRTAWAVIGLLVSLAVLTASDAIFESATGIPAGSPFSSEAGKPDLRFGYTHDQLVALFAAYGPDGRRAYALNLIVDTVYPIVLAAAGILLTARAFPGRRWLWIPPLGFAVADVIENAIFGLALTIHPDIPTWIATVGSPLTQLKLSFFPLAYLVIITAGVIVAGRRLRQ